MNYLNQLLSYPNFSYIEKSRPQEIEMDNADDSERIQKYFDIKKICNISDELEKIYYLKNVAHSVLEFDGNMLFDRKYDHLGYLNIIDAAQKNGDELNCRYKSFIYAQLLIACGFKARWVGCLPMDINDKECHSVTEVYSQKLNKWFVIDISFNYLYFDAKGTLLNLMEMRNSIIKGNKIRFISKDKSNILNTQRYLEKNLFKFRFAEHYGKYMTMDKDKYILLHPENYIVKKEESLQYSYVTTNSFLFW